MAFSFFQPVFLLLQVGILSFVELNNLLIKLRLFISRNINLVEKKYQIAQNSVNVDKQTDQSYLKSSEILEIES